MIFHKKKQMLLILMVSLLTLGFAMMSGGNSADPNVFNEDVFSFRRITLAPLLIIGSYIGLIWLILKKQSN